MWLERKGNTRGFTLLELLASITLLVVLGALLFEVFGQASHVMRIGNARQEIYQFARALFETLERELAGAIGQRDAAYGVANNPNDPRSRPFRVYTSDSALAKFGLPAREGTHAMSFTSALVGRDTIEKRPDGTRNPTYGQTANVAHVAYWVSPDDWVLNRYESYDLTLSARGRGWEFALNVLEFQIQCLDQWHAPIQFRVMDWESTVTVQSGARRGLPEAVMVSVRLTDKDHIGDYEFDAQEKKSKLKEGLTPDDDPMVQEFRQVIRTSESQ
ncbi:MAG: hypothetical protein AMS16_05225 [Planctomycetes bacterium DG_58]|nr:MAG: hypothetical protein AMS16_05225 [Planctomycetes bacterium DG_58]KPL01739.1 MAG: hypothetical protein AMK75_04060 [Planctomycetes bacterium SM23_65]